MPAVFKRQREKMGDQSRFKCRKMVNYYAIRSSLRTCIEPIDLGVVPVPGRDVAVLQMAARPLLLQVPLRLYSTHARPQRVAHSAHVKLPHKITEGGIKTIA